MCRFEMKIRLKSECPSLYLLYVRKSHVIVNWEKQYPLNFFEKINY